MRSTRVWKNGLMVCTALAVAIAGVAVAAPETKRTKETKPEQKTPSFSNRLVAEREIARDVATNKKTREVPVAPARTTSIKELRAEFEALMAVGATAGEFEVFAKNVQKSFGSQFEKNAAFDQFMAEVEHQISIAPVDVQPVVEGGVAGLPGGNAACPAAALGMLTGAGSDSGTTVGMANDFGGTTSGMFGPTGCTIPCGFYGGTTGNDVIYEFTVGTAGAWNFNVCTPAWDSSMQIRTGGACPGTACVGADDDSCLACGTPFAASLTAVLSTGTTYYLIVDTFSSGGAGAAYTLNWSGPPACGDSMIGVGEECDPPDGISCDALCQWICGDGMTQSGEQCDDGNMTNGDGCENDCTLTPAGNDTCATAEGIGPAPDSDTESNATSTDDVTPFCGVSTPNQAIWYSLVGTGNTMTATTCNAPVTNYDTMIQVFCGTCATPICIGGNDDQSGALDEACDTLNIDINRGSTFSWCSEAGATYYVLVGGFSAATGVSQLSVSDDGASCMGAIGCTLGVCGDGNVNVGEECDDGGTMNNDGCDSMCQFEGACCKADGTCLQNLSMSDCSTSGGTYQGDGVDCMDVTCPVCGNGVLNAGEGCDDGNLMNGDGCSASCTCEAIVGVPSNNDCVNREVVSDGNYCFDITSATTDGVVEAVCNFAFGDDNVHNDIWYNYTATCTGILVLDTCGGGNFDTRISVYSGTSCPPGAPIDCDDDDDDSTGLCGNTLESVLLVPVTTGQVLKIRVGEFSAADSGLDLLNIDCQNPICGNGTLEIGEECDDNNMVGNDGCSATCDLEGACCLPNGTCLDNLLEADCTAQPGVYQGDEVACVDVTCPVCGNGTVEAGEECDDSNTMNGDGCDSTCQNEPAANDDCIDRTDVFDGPNPYTLVGSTLDAGAPVPCDTNMTNDVWFNYTATCNGFATIGTCDALGTDTTLQVYNGCNCGGLVDFAPVACADDNCGGGSGFSSTVDVPVVNGNCYKIRVGGWNGGEPTGTLTISCTTPVCGNGTQEAGEECDDSNLVAGDGCDATCSVEGACCLGTNCQQLSDTACAAALGGYQGDGAACGAQCAFGSCCFADGACSELAAGCCADQGGTFTGGETCSPNNCPQPPLVNDDCIDRVTINDGVTAFSTLGATTDGPTHVSCMFDGQTYADVWYNYTATCNGTLTVSTCNTADYDSDVVLYDGWDCGALEDPPLSCNDDGAGCAGFSSLATATVTVGQQIKIRIGGFADETDAGTGTVEITCGGGGGGCDVTCGGGSTAEGEADCGLPTDTVNGGCNSAPEVFSPIACGQSYCGTGAFDGASRDTDWYEIVLASPMTLTWSVEAEFDVVLGFVEMTVPGSGNCADAVALNPFAAPGECNPASISVTVGAGTHWFFVAPDFTNIEACGGEYTASLTCAAPPTGACCGAPPAPNCSCTVTSEVSCLSGGGVYKGDNTVCGGNICDCNTNGVCDQLDFLPSGGVVKEEIYTPGLAITDCDDLLPDVFDTDTHTFVSGCGPVVDLDVALDITHTWVGDLVVDLTHVGSGTTARLISRIGLVEVDPLCSGGECCGNGNDNMDIILDDEAATSIEAVTVAPNGVFRPSPGVLSAFDGLEKCSTWTLTVHDAFGGDPGTLNSWALRFVNVPQIPAVSDDCNANGTPDECELGDDCNNNGIPDECDLVGNDIIPPGGDGIPDDCNCLEDADCTSGDCDECLLTCIEGTPCASVLNCLSDFDNNACNHVVCSGTCQYTCIRYGDVKVPQNNIVNLDDILCILSGFSNPVNCIDADIAPCGGNGIINLDDILAVLNAFAGANPCNCMAAGVSPLCGSTQP